ncbi:MAG: hypothetical protein K6D97_00265 [Clostridia bacterium]|nr:hypothetical protein [Clostridia bacterium]
MFKESSYKHLLFWLKVKRIFFIIFFTLAGSILGGVLSSYLVDVLMFYDISKSNIVLIFALVSFIFASFFTTSISQAIQDGYWKIATLRKLTLISKKLDSLKKIEELLNPEIANEIKETVQEIKNINVLEDKDNYSIFDKEVQSEIQEINTSENNSASTNSTQEINESEIKNKKILKDENITQSGSTSDVSSEQIDKLDGTNLDHISKTIAMLSHEYDETGSSIETASISTNAKEDAEKISIIENTTIEDSNNDSIKDEYDDDNYFVNNIEQPKIEDIEEIVKTIKIENTVKHTYKRKSIPGSSNAIAMATAFEKNKDEVKFKNNIIEENISNNDEQKQIINENNETLNNP